MTETHAFLVRQHEHRVAEGAALRREAYATLSVFQAEGRPEAERVAVGDVHHPLAIRADDPHAGLAGDAGNLDLRRPPLLACLGKAGGEDDGKGDALVGYSAQRSRHAHRRNGNQRDVGSFREGRDVRVCAVTPHAFVAWIDGIDPAFVSMLAQEADRLAADAALVD